MHFLYVEKLCYFYETKLDNGGRKGPPHSAPFIEHSFPWDENNSVTLWAFSSPLPPPSSSLFLPWPPGSPSFPYPSTWAPPPGQIPRGSKIIINNMMVTYNSICFDVLTEQSISTLSFADSIRLWILRVKSKQKYGCCHVSSRVIIDTHSNSQFIIWYTEWNFNPGSELQENVDRLCLSWTNGQIVWSGWVGQRPFAPFNFVARATETEGRGDIWLSNEEGEEPYLRPQPWPWPPPEVHPTHPSPRC